jgi:hypothetical protein
MLFTLRRIRVIAAVTAVVLPADAAESLRVPPVDRIGEAPGEAIISPSMQSGAGLAGCPAWTDGCIVCRRSGDAVGCSNIGIACQPQAPKCLVPAPAIRRQPEGAPPGP